MLHLKMGYNDILSMPTNERRFHISMLVKNKTEEQDALYLLDLFEKYVE